VLFSVRTAKNESTKNGCSDFESWINQILFQVLDLSLTYYILSLRSFGEGGLYWGILFLLLLTDDSTLTMISLLWALPTILYVSR
jgi:hypothetical protein